MSEPTPPDLTAALLAGLAVEADKLAGAARNLRDTYRFSRQLKFIIGAFVVVVAGLVVIAVINLANGHAIRSCTTPGGACYDRGQQETAQAVSQIVAGVNAHTDIVLLATLQCSRHNYTDAQFATCLHAKGVG